MTLPEAIARARDESRGRVVTVPYRRRSTIGPSSLQR